ncbi:MAG: ABC transporter permease [Gammaproteobacteria bacterium]|nr:ABC transporter permease [Gammaproteobacteria bacterium]NNL43987.1 ABC transporter permease [Woeseiaceae bacterium]
MRMLPVLTRLAWRYLWRNHRRTIIMVSAISIGVWAMIFMTALSRGMVDQMIEDGVSALPGHVQVHNKQFLDDPSVSNRILISDAELSRTFDSADFKAWASRVKVPAVISSEYESRGVTLLGIDPVAERAFGYLSYDEVEGRFLEGVDDNSIVIGRKLADKLETNVGKRVVLMSQDPENEIADRGFRVVGLFNSDVPGYEDGNVFVGKKAAQKMLRIGDTTTELVFLGDSYRNVEPTYDRVVASIDGTLDVKRWYEVATYLGSLLKVMDGFVMIWMIVIFLALSFGLVNTLVMAVFERVREIGLMLALGMKPSHILGQIIIESMLLLSVGLAIGNVLSWATIQPLRGGIDISIVAQGMEMMGAASVLYPRLYVSDMILANVIVLSLGFLASLSPAWRASRYEPVEAITKVG